MAGNTIFVFIVCRKLDVLNLENIHVKFCKSHVHKDVSSSLQSWDLFTTLLLIILPVWAVQSYSGKCAVCIQKANIHLC